MKMEAGTSKGEWKSVARTEAGRRPYVAAGNGEPRSKQGSGRVLQKIAGPSSQAGWGGSSSESRAWETEKTATGSELAWEKEILAAQASVEVDNVDAAPGSWVGRARPG
ncbi:hypothetical protein COCMIDRAFT_22734 [Bipolaris oryzae ATCC 44560]|uniref:Uncharacterized protein n=1 Tax=Bipolaris oryzae ATCC 44560 TaxID=930090 RepID=W6ZQI5_COCMI|nr:uncharacterized protein COCMIDRAFT_22734 [Bipolaris oryzae ATCC 44560]EUC49764.1 hypothetical protein COCMIDRAFT_22734 [Bipolaris oryzae ATCC 44560]